MSEAREAAERLRRWRDAETAEERRSVYHMSMGAAVSVTGRPVNSAAEAMKLMNDDHWAVLDAYLAAHPAAASPPDELDEEASRRFHEAIASGEAKVKWHGPCPAADDAEPVTPEWLDDMGFRFQPGKRPEHAGGHVMSLSEPEPADGIFGEELRLVDSVSYWSVEVRSRARDWGHSVGLREITTRGDVRLLLRALGKLPAPPAAGPAKG